MIVVVAVLSVAVPSKFDEKGVVVFTSVTLLSLLRKHKITITPPECVKDGRWHDTGQVSSSIVFKTNIKLAPMRLISCLPFNCSSSSSSDNTKIHIPRQLDPSLRLRCDFRFCACCNDK